MRIYLKNIPAKFHPDSSSATFIIKSI